MFVHRDNDASIQFLKSIDYFAGSQTCTLVFIHTALDKEDDSKTMGPEKQDNEEQLLSQVAALTKSGSVHSTLLPVALVPGPSLRKTSRTWTESKRSIGVLDVLSSPLTTPLPANYVEGLVMQAQNDARKFKQERYSNMTKDLVERLLDDLCNKHTLAHNLGSRYILKTPVHVARFLSRILLTLMASQDIWNCSGSATSHCGSIQQVVVLSARLHRRRAQLWRLSNSTARTPPARFGTVEHVEW